MFQSLRISQVILRIGLAVVFVWFGIAKLIQPQYWLDTWVPGTVQSVMAGIGIGPTDLIYMIGIFEVLVALSLATGYFMRGFALAAALFLVPIMILHGFAEAVVPNIGLFGGLVALALWPQRTYI